MMESIETIAFSGSESLTPPPTTTTPLNVTMMTCSGTTFYSHPSTSKFTSLSPAYDQRLHFPLQRVISQSPEFARLVRAEKKEEDGFFVSDELKTQLLRRQAAIQIRLDPESNPDLPVSVEGFHDFFPLEPIVEGAERRQESILPFKTSVYRVTSEKDGRAYCMRRVHDFKLSNTKCMSLIDKWKRIQHPNIVGLRQVFTTKNLFSVSENSIVFIYDFYAGAESLSSFLGRREAAHAMANHVRVGFKDDANANSINSSSHLLPESAIWSFIIQLSSVIRKIHGMGLACRALSDPSKTLVVGSHRLRISCAGMLDVLLFDNGANGANSQAVTYQQQEDLVSFGKLVLALACHSFTVQEETQAVELVTRNYSSDLKNLLAYFLGNTTRLRNINDIMPMIGARFYMQIDALETRTDRMERELMKEVENGRLFRTLAKLNTVLERPEMGMDPNWSEMGDRYILKLFRDFVFHQVTDERGTPLLDLSHVIQCLNKLDFGSPEKICLMSRDEQNVIIVSYADLKRSFDVTFQQLLEASLQLPFSYPSPESRAVGFDGRAVGFDGRVAGFESGGFDEGKMPIRGRGANIDGI